MIEILWSIAFLLMELKALSESSRREGRLRFHLVGKRHILHEWLLLTLLLDPCILDPAASFTSFFAMYITAFPAIRRRTSPTPIGRTPGFLFSGINRLAVKASKLLSVSEFEKCMFVLHNRFTKFAMDVRSSKGITY